MPVRTVDLGFAAPRTETGVALRRVVVFAIEDTALQIVWGDSAAGRIEVTGAPTLFSVDHPGGPGGVIIDGLAPNTTYDLTVSHDGSSTVERLTAHTLPTPPGEELSRFATVSDLHYGQRKFGVVFKLRDQSGRGPDFADRCAAGALTELADWGAQHLVVKGDLTEGGYTPEWAKTNEALSNTPLPLTAMAGNHDVRDERIDHPRDQFDVIDGELADPVAVTDLPGIRLISVDSSIVGKNRGTIARDGDLVLDAVRSSKSPCFIALHHPLPVRRRIDGYPLGVPYGESMRFLRRLHAESQTVFISSGHSHRHIRRSFRSIPLTEVGSTLNYPGTWAGYAVHEGGIRQVVRRTMVPSAIEWTERSGRAVGGVWARYSPGKLDHRCFTHRWY